MPKISAFQDSQTTLKPNLAWIFLSVGANWNINVCPRTPCRAGTIKIGHNFRKYLRSGPVPHVLDGSSNSKPLLIQLRFVTNQQDFDSQEANFQRTGFDSISGVSSWIWKNKQIIIYGLLFRKLFWPNVRKNYSFEKWRLRIFKNFEITRTFFWKVKGEDN